MNVIFFIVSVIVTLFLLFIVIEKAVQRGIDSSKLGVIIREYIEEREHQQKK